MYTCVHAHTHTHRVHTYTDTKISTLTRGLHRQLTPMGHSQTQNIELNKIKTIIQNNLYNKKTARSYQLNCMKRLKDEREGNNYTNCDWCFLVQ